MEYLSKLPDDVIKYVESFVDKRPPFADELLNREFTYYGVVLNGGKWLPTKMRHCCGFNLPFEGGSSYKSVQAVNYKMTRVNTIDGVVISVDGGNFDESLYEYSFDKYKDFSPIARRWAITTYGRLMMNEKYHDFDPDIPSQTFNCGMSYCKPRPKNEIQ